MSTPSMEKIISASLNRYLGCDSERRDELQKIDGKVIAVKIKQLDAIAKLQVEQLKFKPVEHADIDTDVEIIVSVKALPDFLLGVDRNQLIKNGDIEIIGDMHVASIFHNVLKEVEIDWEEILAARIGDTAASQIGFGAKKLQGFMRTVGENIQLDTRDYLQDNLQVAVTQDEVEYICTGSRLLAC